MITNTDFIIRDSYSDGTISGYKENNLNKYGYYQSQLILGQNNIASGDYSAILAGRNATTLHSGAVIIADSRTGLKFSTAPNTLFLDFANGVYSTSNVYAPNISQDVVLKNTDQKISGIKTFYYTRFEPGWGTTPYPFDIRGSFSSDNLPNATSLLLNWGQVIINQMNGDIQYWMDDGSPEYPYTLSSKVSSFINIDTQDIWGDYLVEYDEWGDPIYSWAQVPAQYTQFNFRTINTDGGDATDMWHVGPYYPSRVFNFYSMKAYRSILDIHETGGMNVYGNVVIGGKVNAVNSLDVTKTPTASSTPATSGQVAFDKNYMYRHNGTNWTKIAFSDWNGGGATNLVLNINYKGSVLF